MIASMVAQTDSSSLTGLLGGGALTALVWLIASILTNRRQRSADRDQARLAVDQATWERAQAQLAQLDGQNDAHERRIVALEAELTGLRAERDHALDRARAAERRADEAEEQVQQLECRVHHLEVLLERRKRDDLPPPGGIDRRQND